MEKELQSIFDAIKKKYNNLNNPCDKKDFVNSLRMMSKWNDSVNYPEIRGKIKFPETIHIAYAVCNTECGAKEFIVDGGTQRCQHDGGLMFRGPVRQYRLSSGKISRSKGVGM
jgi:hypothetical protein